MMRSKMKGLTLLAMGSLIACALPVAAQQNNTYVQHAQRFAISPPLRDLAKMPQQQHYGLHLANPVRRVPKRASNGMVVDTVEQNSALTPSANYSVGANILGVGNGFPGYSVPDAPTDVNMAVGDTQVVQWVNTSYTVCQKTSPYTCGPSIEGNVLWSSLGGTCANNNDGDIIAQWDVAAHRWLLTQNVFSSPYAVCVAISTSTDANGSYYLYQFPVVNNGFPDYPKWGIWTNNYGETWNNFGTGSYVGPVFCAYNRSKFLAGDHTAEQICHQYGISPNYNDSLLPADRDSIVAPPNGEDQFAIGSVGDIDNSHLSLYSVHINNNNDWSQGATFTGDNDDQLIAIATFNPACNGNYGGACVPQKTRGAADNLDSLGDRLMYRFAYWEDQPLSTVKATPPNPVPLQHWFVDFDVTASGGQNAVRWMEFIASIRAVQPTDLQVFQQGTYAPDGNWRWMGSIARDKMGDVLVGYSESCGDTCPGGTPMYPSIYLAGRTVNDPIGLGNLESEVAVVNGTGAQISTGNRWGDYTSMRIDTTDGMGGCTFWYTNQYYTTTAQFDWSTQIASAKFANCH